MSIKLSHNTVMLWFLDLDGESDVCGALERSEDGGFEMNYRFRYYTCENDTDAFSGWDEKNWYTGRTTRETTEEEAVKVVRDMLSMLEEACGNKADVVQANSAEEYMEILKTKPWAQMKVLSAEEAEERGLA
jgi:hypothetical protein